MKSKAARTKPKKLIRRTSAHARVATEVKVAVHKKSFRAQRRGLQRSPSGDPEEESPIPEQLRDPICVQAAV